MSAATALSAIPPGLRDPLLSEYREITKNYAEHRWRPSELSGGHFCEIVYTILDGHAAKAYASVPSKPSDFVGACRKLEKNTHVPRSFQILIPRMLPALYEVRNNRNVGHAGGDVDPNHMDATLVVGMSNWIMGELVRVFHKLTTQQAQAIVDTLAERSIPLVWQSGEIKLVLDPDMTLADQVLLLIASTPDGVVFASQLMTWCEIKEPNQKLHFLRTLRRLHEAKKVYRTVAGENTFVQILPPGTKHVSEMIAKRQTI